MVPLTALWLPILLSAVVVFLASSILHMVLRYHRTDYGALPQEDQIGAAFRAAGVAPGAYHVPHCRDPKEMGSPEMLERYEKGPVALIHVFPNRPPAMGKYLALWFLFCLLISVFVAYLAGRTLAPGTEYLEVFRVAGTAAFLGYGVGEISSSIWKGQPWGVTFKHLFDGLVYALLTAGVFGWLWP